MASQMSLGMQMLSKKNSSCFCMTMCPVPILQVIITVST